MNPYTAIQGDQAMAQPPEMAPPIEMEIIREGGLKHEYSIKSVGTLYYLGGIITAIACLFMTIAYVSSIAAPGSVPGGTGMEMLIGGLIYLPFAVIYFTLGYGLKRVRPWVRIPGGILSGLSLLSIPIGTIIGGYILWLVAGKQGSYIFSPEYQEAIKMTPHMKYKPKTSWIVLGFLFLLIAGIIAAGVWAAMSA